MEARIISPPQTSAVGLPCRARGPQKADGRFAKKNWGHLALTASASPNPEFYHRDVRITEHAHIEGANSIGGQFNVCILWGEKTHETAK